MHTLYQYRNLVAASAIISTEHRLGFKNGVHQTNVLFNLFDPTD